MHEATVCRIVRKVETALLRSGVFELLGKKQLLDPEFVAKLVVVDATETPIERPKKGQKRFYSGKKKRHPLKSQLVVDPVTKAVIWVVLQLLLEDKQSSSLPRSLCRNWENLRH